MGAKTETPVKYGLNGATTMPLDQAAEIKVAGAVGFDFLELREFKIKQFLEKGTIEGLRDLLDAQKLKVLSINAINNVNTRPPGGEEAMLQECRTLASWAQKLGCPYVVAAPGFVESPVPATQMIDRTVACLAPLAEITAAHGLCLGFEFLGLPKSAVSSLGMARKIVSELGRRDVGLVIDSFHFYLGGEPLGELEKLQPGQLYLFHVNDAEALPREKLTDENRLLPGQGVMPVREMWKILRECLSIDKASLELFRPQYWALPPEGHLREALDAMRRIFT